MEDFIPERDFYLKGQMMRRTGKVRSRVVSGICGLSGVMMIGACSYFNPPPFSKNEIRWADRAILFRDVSHHMRSMEGQRVILGGKILSVKTAAVRSLVFVREYPLNQDFRPDTDKPSMGDFAISTDQPLPPDRFRPGHTVEVIGEIRAPIRVAIGRNSVRTIPLVSARHIHGEAPPPPPDPMMMDPGMMDPGMMDPGMMGPGFMGPMMW